MQMNHNQDELDHLIDEITKVTYQQQISINNVDDDSTFFIMNHSAEAPIPGITNGQDQPTDMFIQEFVNDNNKYLDMRNW